MKQLLTAKLLLFIYVLVFTGCSKDDGANPNLKSPESLASTKWNWVSWGYETGDEMGPEISTTISFIDESNIERTTVDENGQSLVTQLAYQISKDTLIAFERTEVNYFLIKEQTNSNLTLSRVKYQKLSTNEVTTAPSGVFKYSKVVK